MMKALIATLCLGALYTSAFAAPCASLHEEKSAGGALAAENDWVAVLKAKDEARLSCRLADDFVDTSWRGALRSKDDMLAALEHPSAATNAVSDLSVRLIGDVAIVRGLNMATPAPDAPTVRIRFTDVFVYQGGYWRAVSAQETPER